MTKIKVGINGMGELEELFYASFLIAMNQLSKS